ncbi:MAG: adenosine kinase [Pseudomonadota bacterium]|nr:adenosine kinase [Pseudomonadota bacterium]
MTASYDVAGIGNALVDIIAPADEAFLQREGLEKGSMTLVDEVRAETLYERMGPRVQASGGSAANTMAGLASLGGRGAYMGKVADDELGAAFAHDIRAIGVRFESAPLPRARAATGRCMINVTPDGHRTMTTFLGASNLLGPDDVDPAVIADSAAVFLEGYLFNSDTAREAFRKAARLAHAAGREVALTLSDTFVVEGHRAELLAFLGDVDVLFANEAEVSALFECGFDDAIEQLRTQVRAAGVTRSEKGSVAVSAGAAEAVPAEPVDHVVDTTGAGDQYAAGFLFGRTHGWSPRDCARLGHLAAGEVIAHYGPRPQTSLAELARGAGLQT